MIAKRSPPIPFIMGSTTPMTALVATAASTALPPCASTLAPACAANGFSADTTPLRVITMERPCVRSCAPAREADTIIPSGRKITQSVMRTNSFMDLLGKNSRCCGSPGPPCERQTPYASDRSLVGGVNDVKLGKIDEDLEPK